MLSTSLSSKNGLKVPSMDINAPNPREPIPSDIGATNYSGTRNLHSILPSLKQEGMKRIH